MIWPRVLQALEDFEARVGEGPVSPPPGSFPSGLSAFDFERPVDALEAIDFVVDGLRRYQVHTPHPSYFGLFNPAPMPMGVVADTLVAGFNPQLASWSHSPFANEVERHLIRCLGTRFGFPAERVDGTFTSGGAEANHTALLTALTAHFPQLRTGGLRSLPGQPVFYLSSEAHHSFHKAARTSGLGLDAVHTVPVDEALRLDVRHLEDRIEADRRAGRLPFMLVGTAGSTSAGVVDPLPQLGALASRHGLWYHVDAAWGGAAMLVPELQHVLEGVASADSITFDAHKWLSVPMGAGLYLTRHPDILDATFDTEASYMPRQPDQTDPYRHSLQWSRRFIGLKVFLSLAVAGWEGYASILRHQAAMGDLLRTSLRSDGWTIVNETLLPVVCFTHPGVNLEDVARRVVDSGAAWLSTTQVGDDRRVLRACITNYRTSSAEVASLVAALARVRQS